MTTTLEEQLTDVDFSRFSKIKDSLLLKLKLRREAILEEQNEEMSLEELDYVAAAGKYIPPDRTNDFINEP